jgi:hypothetical protein
MFGSVDGEDIATLASLIQDFERELGIDLRVDEPTRLRTKLLNAGTLVDLRSLLLDETEGFMEEPTSHFLPAQPTTRYLPTNRPEVTKSTVTRRVIPLKRRWSAFADRPTDEHVHLFVRRRDGETKQTPVVAQDDIVEMVINLSEPADQDVVSRITDAIGEALGPECLVDRLEGESPDAVYLQSVDEMRNPSSNFTGRWFEEGLRAERQLELGPGTGPLPAMYEDDSLELPPILDDWDEDDSAWDTVSHTGGPRWITFVFTVLVVVLGLSFLRTDGVLGWLEARVSQLVALLEEDVLDRSPPRAGTTARPATEELETRAPCCRWNADGPVFDIEAGLAATGGRRPQEQREP